MKYVLIWLSSQLKSRYLKQSENFNTNNLIVFMVEEDAYNPFFPSNCSHFIYILWSQYKGIMMNGFLRKNHHHIISGEN